MVYLTELSEEFASPSQTSDHRYNVYLSFRGADTRQSFTDHLYKALLDANISTFLDDEEIQTGEDLKPELERAIKGSSASIVVLSKNYASSTWCLDELVLILEMRRTSKHDVIPIFYHVQPTDIRKQQSSFGDALAKHKRRMEQETDIQKRNHYAHKMELWKKALTEVADLKGMDVTGWLETKFIEEIVREANSRLDLHLQCKIPHIIGMRSSLDTITSWLKDGSSHSANILTIWGMAGIGKTSLAKYIYQHHYHEFARCSFIEDIERRWVPQVISSLLELQKNMLEDLHERNVLKLHDFNQCTTKLENVLLRNRTLLVLDGIDNFEQLDLLLGTKGFHPGSKIIITTKDGSLTEKCGLFGTNVVPKHTKHLVKALNKADSLSLLCWHAFRCYDPKEGYKEEAIKLVKHCGGHPLALKVLGSSLRNEDVVAWEETLDLLEKELNPDIRKVLQISFDSLPSENDKELFKHIACFFVGKEREFTRTILEGCGIRTRFAFSKLIDRCLVMVGPRNELMMHQLLQQMGRDLVRLESPEKPWKRSRLWCHEESYNVLKQGKGTVKIQGLLLDMKMIEKDTSHGTSTFIDKNYYGGDVGEQFGPVQQLNWVQKVFSRIWCLIAWVFQSCSSRHHKHHLKTDAFSKMEKLRLLQLDYVQLDGSYKHFPKSLRWLSMHGFPLCYIPSDIQLENMVALDMSYSNLQQLWKKPMMLPSLKIINLTSSEIVRMTGFSRLPALERLILAGCVRLVEVSESIGQCDRLLVLDLSDCNKLKTLPRSLKKLTNLRKLSIGGCANFDEFPREIKHMESLEVLNASDININSKDSPCAIVKVLPRRVKSFSPLFPCSLVCLSLRNNSLFDESFPMDFSSLTKLKVLNLSRNPITSLPDCVKSLRSLEFLCLEGCHRLKSIYSLPHTIKFLDANKCSLLEKITYHPEFFINLCKPVMIGFLASESLTEIEGIRKLQPLAQVDEEIPSSLGWRNLDLVQNQQMVVFDLAGWDRPKELPVQMSCELGIFSISLKGMEIPEWFVHKSQGSSISFIVPSNPKRLRGLNTAYVYTVPPNRFGDWIDTTHSMCKTLGDREGRDYYRLCIS